MSLSLSLRCRRSTQTAFRLHDRAGRGHVDFEQFAKLWADCDAIAERLKPDLDAIARDIAAMDDDERREFAAPSRPNSGGWNAFYE